MNKPLSLASALAFALLAPAVYAQGMMMEEEEEPHFDVFVGRSEADSSQTLIGGALLDDPDLGDVLNLTERLFEADSEPSDSTALGDFHRAAEPGFFNAGEDAPGRLGATNPDGALALIPGERVEVTWTGDVSYWDGVGTDISDVDFNPVSSIDVLIDPRDFDTASETGSLGSIDDHPVFVIDDPNSDTLPANGIYLASFTARLSGIGTTPGTDPSEVFSILFVTNPAFEEAVELAEVALTVPEPATLGLVAGFGVLLAGRRRG